VRQRSDPTLEQKTNKQKFQNIQILSPFYVLILGGPRTTRIQIEKKNWDLETY
jgi:hypothetical protein